MEQVNDQVQPTKPAPVELKRMNMAATLAICWGGWLIPGLAHLLIGRWIRGLMFAACVLLMFAFGLAMHGKLYGLEFDEPLHVFAFIANIGIGIPYWIADRLHLGIGTMTWPSYDYGTTYLLVCGLFNYLNVFDAIAIAHIRRTV